MTGEINQEGSNEKLFRDILSSWGSFLSAISKNKRTDVEHLLSPVKDLLPRLRTESESDCIRLVSEITELVDSAVKKVGDDNKGVRCDLVANRFKEQLRSYLDCLDGLPEEYKSLLQIHADFLGIIKDAGEEVLDKIKNSHVFNCGAKSVESSLSKLRTDPSSNYEIIFVITHIRRMSTEIKNNTSSVSLIERIEQMSAKAVKLSDICNAILKDCHRAEREQIKDNQRRCGA